jgi:hypothetical protein
MIHNATVFRIPLAELAYALERQCKEHPDDEAIQQLGERFSNNIMEAGSLHAMAICCFHKALGQQGSGVVISRRAAPSSAHSFHVFRE